MTRTSLWLCSVAALCLAGCSPAAETIRSGSQALGEAKDDIAYTVTDLFSYKPKPRTPQPSSTRYCYQFASDIVCYDQPQPQLNAKLTGVQGAEGARIITQPAPYATASTTTTVTAVSGVPVAPVTESNMPIDTSAPVTTGTIAAPAPVESHTLTAPH